MNALNQAHCEACRADAPQVSDDHDDDGQHFKEGEPELQLAEDDLERMFDPFIRLDGSRTGNGGFGLGLSIARNAVQRQGGRLWAENTGQGLRRR